MASATASRSTRGGSDKISKRNSKLDAMHDRPVKIPAKQRSGAQNTTMQHVVDHRTSAIPLKFTAIFDGDECRVDRTNG
jgi:hypothetical protein